MTTFDSESVQFILLNGFLCIDHSRGPEKWWDHMKRERVVCNERWNRRIILFVDQSEKISVSPRTVHRLQSDGTVGIIYFYRTVTDQGSPYTLSVCTATPVTK